MTGPPTGHSSDVVEWAKALIFAPLTEPVVCELIELARSAERDQAQMAAWALGFGETPDYLPQGVVRALLDVLVDTTRPGAVRGQAADAVAEQLEFTDHLDPARLDAETSLTEMLNDPSAPVRFWSAVGLGKLRTTAALPSLGALTVDTTPVPGWWTVGEEAADAIDTIEGRQFPERLGRNCRQRHESRRLEVQHESCRPKDWGPASRSSHLDGCSTMEVSARASRTTVPRAPSFRPTQARTADLNLVA